MKKTINEFNPIKKFSEMGVLPTDSKGFSSIDEYNSLVNDYDNCYNYDGDIFAKWKNNDHSKAGLIKLIEKDIADNLIKYIKKDIKRTIKKFVYMFLIVKCKECGKVISTNRCVDHRLCVDCEKKMWEEIKYEGF
jgi:ribosomal protein L32